MKKSASLAKVSTNT